MNARPGPGLGLAWDGAVLSDCQLTNTPVGQLRLSEQLQPTFETWLRQRYPHTFGADQHLYAAYPPRRYFGEYVNEMCDAMAGFPGVSIRTATEVTRIEKEGGYTVTCCDANGKEDALRADSIVLCTGAPAAPGQTRFAHLRLSPGYVDSPWPASSLTDALATATRVAILGTGLTAVDTAKHLSEAFPDLPVIMTSRRGRLNVVARDLRRAEVREQPPYARRVLTDELIASLPQRVGLEHLVDLLFRELDAASDELEWDAVRRSDVDGLSEWRHHVMTRRAGGRYRWQLALSSIEGVFPSLWARLSDRDRARWSVSEEKLILQNYANPLPMESACRLLDRVDAGMLRIEGACTALTQPNRVSD